MRITILSAAESDLETGHRFYESQAVGLGTYFLDTLYSDIDSLAYFAGKAFELLFHAESHFRGGSDYDKRLATTQISKRCLSKTF